MDLNDTVVFEYYTETDTMCFSENISNYMPMATQIENFAENLSSVAKVHEDDTEKAISFLTSKKQLNVAYLEYVRILDNTGEFRWYQLKGMIPSHRAEDEPLFCGTISYIAMIKNNSMKNVHFPVKLRQDCLQRTFLPLRHPII